MDQKDLKGDEVKNDSKAIWIDCGSYRLEGLYRKASAERVAIICHPHPLYGGNMDNNIVTTLEEGFSDRGWSTVRFNFRGVGGSDGAHDGGRGERDDLLAVWKRFAGSEAQTTALAGYSFGAWMALKACGPDCCPDGLVLVSPPVTVLDFNNLHVPATKALVVLGEIDELAPPAAVRSWLKNAAATDPDLKQDVIVGADHFYLGRESKVYSSLVAFLQGFDKKPEDQFV